MIYPFYTLNDLFLERAARFRAEQAECRVESGHFVL